MPSDALDWLILDSLADGAESIREIQEHVNRWESNSMEEVAERLEVLHSEGAVEVAGEKEPDFTRLHEAPYQDYGMEFWFRMAPSGREWWEKHGRRYRGETRRPTPDEIRELVEEQLRECTPEQRSFFEQSQVKPRLTDLWRAGGRKRSFYVVAVHDGEALYWEDAEEGFNVCPLDAQGRLTRHWCNQDNLRIALHRWMRSLSKA